MRNLYFSVVVVVGFVFLLSGSAKAGLTVCNKTDSTVYVAVAEWHGDCFLMACEERVQGWWKIDPGSCKNPIGGSLVTPNGDGVDQYFYWAHNDSSTWAGDTTFCVDPVNAFDYKDESTSKCDDSSKRQFKEIKTESYSDFTLNLT